MHLFSKGTYRILYSTNPTCSYSLVPIVPREILDYVQLPSTYAHELPDTVSYCRVLLACSMYCMQQNLCPLATNKFVHKVYCWRTTMCSGDMLVSVSYQFFFKEVKRFISAIPITLLTSPCIWCSFPVNVSVPLTSHYHATYCNVDSTTSWKWSRYS